MRLTDRTLRIWAWALFALFIAAGWGSSLLLARAPGIRDRLGLRRRHRQPGVRPDGHVVPARGRADHPAPAAQPDRLGPDRHRGQLGAGALGDMYSAWALVLHPGSLPGGEVVVAVNSALWLPPILLMGVYLILLFPDGHLPSPRWRILPWATLAVGVFGFLAIALLPGTHRRRGDPGEGEPARRRGTRGLFDVAVRDRPSAHPAGRARGSRRRRAQVSPGEWRRPAPDEVADGCGRRWSRCSSRRPWRCR